MPAKQGRGGKCEPRFHRRRRQWLSPSKERRSRQGRRTSGECPNRRDGTLAEYSEWEPSFGLQMAATMLLSFKSRWRAPRRWCPEMENKVARTYLRQSRLRTMGLSEGCLGCRHLRTGQGRQQAHSEACWKRIEALLKGDPSGSARLAAAYERFNRAVADAVERHATKDPGLTGILKRPSVVCHPESKPQKQTALDTGQDLTPTPFSLPWRIISIRCTTWRHHRHRPKHELERRDERNETRTRTHPGRDSSKQQGSHWWRCRDGGGQCGRKQCVTPEPVGIRQQKGDHNEERTT